MGMHTRTHIYTPVTEIIPINILAFPVYVSWIGISYEGLHKLPDLYDFL